VFPIARQLKWTLRPARQSRSQVSCRAATTRNRSTFLSSLIVVSSASSFSHVAGGRATSAERHETSFPVTGVQRVAFHAASIPSARRRVRIARFAWLPSLYFPAVTLPPAPWKCR
jgi:hypothetical protein